MAGLVADATSAVEGIAPLTRAELCAACAKCPHALQAQAINAIVGPPFSV